MVQFYKMIDESRINNPFCSASPEIIGVKVYHRWTDRQTNYLTPYTGDFFFQFNLLPSYSLRLQGENSGFGFEFQFF